MTSAASSSSFTSSGKFLRETRQASKKERKGRSWTTRAEKLALQNSNAWCTPNVENCRGCLRNFLLLWWWKIRRELTCQLQAIVHCSICPLFLFISLSPSLSLIQFSLRRSVVRMSSSTFYRVKEWVQHPFMVCIAFESPCPCLSLFLSFFPCSCSFLLLHFVSTRAASSFPFLSVSHPDVTTSFLSSTYLTCRWSPLRFSVCFSFFFCFALPCFWSFLPLHVVLTRTASPSHLYSLSPLLLLHFDVMMTNFSFQQMCVIAVTPISFFRISFFPFFLCSSLICFDLYSLVLFSFFPLMMWWWRADHSSICLNCSSCCLLHWCLPALSPLLVLFSFSLFLVSSRILFFFSFSFSFFSAFPDVMMTSWSFEHMSEWQLLPLASLMHCKSNSEHSSLIFSFLFPSSSLAGSGVAFLFLLPPSSASSFSSLWAYVWIACSSCCFLHWCM